MEITLKFNDRIQIVKSSIEECIFLIDGKKKATFEPRDSEIYNLINDLNSIGIKKQNIKHISFYQHRERAYKFINNMEINDFINYKITLSDKLKIQIHPTKTKFCFPLFTYKPIKKINISEHTYLRYSKNFTIIENPLSTFKILIDDLSFNLQTLIKNKFKDNDLISILLDGHFITESNFNQCNWEFHDLLFHTKSRLGLIDDSINFGGTFKNKPKNLSIHNGFKDFPDKKYYPFNFINKITSDSQGNFFESLQTRNSSRSFSKGKTPSFENIGEFLFHVAKVIQSSPQNDNLDFVKRSFPSAGGIHDLEFYLLINRNNALSKDIYYYHPQKHGLYQLEVQEKYLDEITQNTMIALGNPEVSPPVIIILTSRFIKMRSKYERIAYRNTILSVGAAYQTMYLTGANLNLSTCAIGSGNPDLFAKAIRTDPYEELAVGEFALG